MYTSFIGLEISWVLHHHNTIDDVKHFVKAVQTEIHRASNNSLKATVTTYDYDAQRIMKCEDYKTVESFNENVDKIEKTRNAIATNIRDGLENGLHSLMNDGCGENNVRRIIILILNQYNIHSRFGLGGEDGIVKTSKAIQEAGITIFAFTVARLFDIDRQLTTIVSSKDDITPIVAGYDDVNFINDFLDKICNT